jgi:hypothetical protein
MIYSEEDNVQVTFKTQTNLNGSYICSFVRCYFPFSVENKIGRLDIRYILYLLYSFGFLLCRIRFGKATQIGGKGAPARL